MTFDETDVVGAFLIRPTLREDARGHFARIWCDEEFSEHRLIHHIAQINAGFSPRAGTLRGMHFQRPPHAEAKIARCVRGAAFDVVVDLRGDSPTFMRWAGATLTPANGQMLYVPPGCAHGYMTLEPDTELIYFTSHRYEPHSAGGVRHDDPAFGIEWPIAASVISEADATWPLFSKQSAIQ